MVSSSRPESGSPPARWAALALSPRAAVVLAGVVVVVAVVVVLIGSWSGASSGHPNGGDRLTVTGAPSPGPSGGGGGVGRVPGAAGTTAASASAGPVVVHVVGAVARPGVVTLPARSRVTEALDRAGGAGRDADLTRLNLARVVEDGERVYVPRVGEADIPATVDGGPMAGSAPSDSSGAGAGGAGGSGPDAVVDLNTADQAALETLPGIGPSLAGRILAWRDEHGRFAAIEDLLEVNGIGDGRFADLRDRVTV